MTGDREKQFYYRAVTDSWRLFLKYRHPVDAPEYWQALNDEAKQVSIRYGEARFVESMLLVFLNEIDRIWERRRKARRG